MSKYCIVENLMHLYSRQELCDGCKISIKMQDASPSLIDIRNC